MKNIRLGLTLLLLAFASPTYAQTLTLSGDVTYREHIALPPNATLRVRLIDSDRPEVAATVEAEAAIADAGRVPLTFTLNFEQGMIVKGRSYALVAEIAAGREVWFRNVEPYAIDPLAPANPIVVVANFTGRTTARTEPEVSATVPVLDVTWQAETIGGAPVIPLSESSLSIASDMRAGGRGGCNSYFAQAKIDGDSIRFSAVAATRMACLAAEVMEQEANFFSALSDTRFWRLSEDKLYLIDGAGRELIRFARSAL